MTSQIESSRWTLYTPLYKNEQFEREILVAIISMLFVIEKIFQILVVTIDLSL